MKFLITIDGPAGAGKTTVSKILAEKLGYKYIDTGALYRGLAYKAVISNIDKDEDIALKEICFDVDLKFINIDNKSSLFLDGEDISPFIRTPAISMLASYISAKPFVREALLDIQKRLGKDRCAVFEGRDMGTIVFPDADFKFFLDASVKVRAERRYKELLKNSDFSGTLEEVEKDIIKRDKNDSSRSIAPLKPAKDAIIIDSSRLSINEAVQKMLSFIL